MRSGESRFAEPSVYEIRGTCLAGRADLLKDGIHVVA
jgi:hypothetical protein